ncbi:xanthine dehydrogenase family protein molybdopterin-binding subunit [Labrys monachus]|uniref:Isoquinoline 1-oxidoreductase beta subunit n=1 Tax=Labrys monachus TaxID=217067 RepID=A0ABU0FER0_9HYPH|nr:xanthine dehydrogenase family protein molybdopterin-binding subunit [Labrys monachus]MDQ0393095.1 isoquinoline 1-oxidoreductase beta subunit [Labrys monachus]
MTNHPSIRSGLAGTLPPAATRRGFLQASGLLLGFLWLGGGKAGAVEALAAGGTFAPNAFIRVAADGSITFIIPNTEMGQGIYTAEAMLIAEELEVGLDQIQVMPAPPNAKLYAAKGSQITGGSTSIRNTWTPLRRAGAAARTMLIAAAAAQWGVDAGECRAARAVITHAPTGRSLSYGAFADAAGRLPVPGDVALKSPKDFKLIGTPARRVETPSKVDGSALFGIDVKVDGMKTAAIEISPVFGGKLKSLDDSAARAMPGVVDILKIDDAVAVVGDHYWAARQGLAALKIEWEPGDKASISSAGIWDDLRQASQAGTPIEGRAEGDVEAAMKAAARTVEATYELPFLAHATMEPINTLVHVRPDACEIWVGTQVPVSAQAAAAAEAGLKPEQVTIHNYLIGGGFGRRLAVDTIQQAVAFAKQVGYPLKIIWTREQDIRFDRFRPAYYDRISAGLDAGGKPVAWTHRVTSGSVLASFLPTGLPAGKLDNDTVEGAARPPYDLPVIRVDWIRKDPPIAVNWWRGVGPTHNVFVVESFIDELAHTAGKDPVDYRRALLTGNHRALGVLDLAAEKAGWGTPLPAGSGRGIALHDSFGSHTALVVELAVAPSGEIRLTRLVAAIDCGINVNPDTIRAQLQGGAVFGLSAALYNGITFSGGRVDQGNFNDYRQMRINEVPPFETYIVESHADPGGLGETATAAAAPALGNAIFAATGRRLRRLPFDRDELRTTGGGRTASLSLSAAYAATSSSVDR